MIPRGFRTSISAHLILGLVLIFDLYCTVESFVVNIDRLSYQCYQLCAKVDPVRDASGIRPSLHPVTINALSDALKIRAKKLDNMPLRKSDGVQPIHVALAAGRIASEAIHKRQMASSSDGMKLSKEEEQTIAGRVVGVVMRLPELENELLNKCSSVPWIAKYNEWASFGVLSVEASQNLVDDRILSDPLFTVSRAECLLALFLETVEKPSLAKCGQSVPGGSKVDFLDADRIEVLLSKQCFDGV